MEQENVSLGRLFAVFFKMGAFTIGGGYAMLPLVEKELTSRGWVSEEDMQELIVLAQSAPGILAVNLAIYTGHKLRGLRGSLVATLGAVLPSFVIIVLIAMFFDAFKDSTLVGKIFQGMRPAAVALILVAAVRMGKKACKSWWTYLVAFASMLAVAAFKISPIWIILAIIACAVIVTFIANRRKGDA